MEKIPFISTTPRSSMIVHDLIFKSQEAHVSNGVRYEESLHSVQILAESHLLQGHEHISQVRPVSTFGSGILCQKPGGALVHGAPNVLTIMLEQTLNQ